MWLSTVCQRGRFPSWHNWQPHVVRCTLVHTSHTLTSLILQVTILRRHVSPVGLLQTVERIVVTSLWHVKLAFPSQSKTTREVTVLCDIPFNTECLALPHRPLYPSMNWKGRCVRIIEEKMRCLCRESSSDFSVFSNQRGQKDWTGAGCYLQEISEIEVGRERSWVALLGRCHLHFSRVNDVAPQEARASNIGTHPSSTFGVRSCRKPMAAVPWWTVGRP